MTNELTLPTRDEVRRELAGRLLADAQRISGLHGTQAAARLLGKQNAPADKLVHPQQMFASRPPGALTIDDVKLDELPVGRLAMALYEYAFEFRHPLGMTPNLLSDEMEALEDFVFNFRSEVAELFQGDPWHMGDAGDANWQALPQLCDHARARVILDLGEDDLTLRQVGLLARMTERSIKNAMGAPGEQRLIARDGMVTNEDARKWLQGRREFVPTRFVDVSQMPGEHPARLATLSDLGHYLRVRWDGLGKTDEAIIKELDWPTERLDELRTIIASPQTIDPRDCDDLARSLLVSSRWFTEQVMRLLFPRQMELLTPDIGDAASPPAAEVPQQVLEAAAGELGVNKICTRLMFVLDNGTKVFPSRMKRRGTTTATFRLSPGGAGTNTLEAGLEIEDEDEMIDLVINKSYAVRMTAERGGQKNLYKRTSRLVRAVYVDGRQLT